MRLGFSGGSFYFYSDGVWRRMTEHDKIQIDYILDEICRTVSVVYSTHEKLIWRSMETNIDLAFSASQLDNHAWVATRRHSVNVETMEREPHSPEHMTTRFVDVEDIPNAKCERWQKMLDRMFEDRPPVAREELKELLQEWFGVALMGGSLRRTPRELRKALFLWGPPRTGKSTVAAVLERLVGVDRSRIVTASIEHVTKSFGLEAFIDGAAWITEEVSGMEKRLDTPRVKSLITGEPMTVSRKYKSDVVLHFTGPVLWASNTAPTWGEQSEAIYSRVLAIEFNRQFTEEEATKTFKGKKPIDWLSDLGEIEGIFQWAVQGYQRVSKRGRFAEPEDMKQSRSDWRDVNEPIVAFVRDYCEFDPNSGTEAKALSLMVGGFLAAGGRERINLHGVNRKVFEAVRDVLPNVQSGFRSRQFGRDSIHRGLKVKKEGIAYLQKAATFWPEANSSDLIVNSPLSFGGGSGGTD